NFIATPRNDRSGHPIIMPLPMHPETTEDRDYDAKRNGVDRSIWRCYVPEVALKPEWRNWHTQQTQNLPGFTPRGGSSPFSGIHQIISKVITSLLSAPIKQIELFPTENHPREHGCDPRRRARAKFV